MAPGANPTRLDTAMTRVGMNARQLAMASGVDHSLITKWRRGARPLQPGSTGLRPVARALAGQDADGALAHLVEPFRYDTGSLEGDLALYLCGEDRVWMPPRAAPPKRPYSGEYDMTSHVYLGKKGMQRATVDVLEYVLSLPPGREIVCVAHGNFDWVTANLPYVMMLISRLKKAFERGTTLTMIIRKGFAVTDVAMFAGPWVIAHMRGYIQSLYYEGALPPGDRIVASIRDYWCLEMKEDSEVEDSLFITVHTDPLSIRHDVQLCDDYHGQAAALAVYDVFRHPRGPLPLPPYAFTRLTLIERIPGICLLTRDEFAKIAGDEAPDAPAFFFLPEDGFAKTPMRLVLCREDMRRALVAARTEHAVFSEMAGRRVYLPKPLLHILLARICGALQNREDFEVAVVPKVAFDRIGLEMAGWRGGAILGWLSDSTQSVYSDDPTMHGSINGYADFVWDKLLSRWKAKRFILPLLRKWLRGQGLDTPPEDTTHDRNWSVLPKD